MLIEAWVIQHPYNLAGKLCRQWGASILLIILALSTTLYLLAPPQIINSGSSSASQSQSQSQSSSSSSSPPPSPSESLSAICRGTAPTRRPPIACGNGDDDGDDVGRLQIAPPIRAHIGSIADFGGIGDGIALNTNAFELAIANLSALGSGGAQLNIPPGLWLTGCFRLTSHFTLWLHKDAVLLGSPDPREWPLTEPLPSYGTGRERPGMRHCSLVHGKDLTDVWITGDNGTIDGQGWGWWEMWRNRSLEHTRGHLVEFVSSEDVVISNVVLRNSPFWTLHPVYCNNVVVKNVTILAPWDAPNTDGIDPDSSANVCIEDCYISNGDDLVAVKSGWDGYGARAACPSVNVTIRRLSGTTRTCAGIAIGSEVSGGVARVRAEDLDVSGSAYGLRVKTAPGRGGFITDVSFARVRLTDVRQAIVFSGDSGDHVSPALDTDNNSCCGFTLVVRVSVRDVVGRGIGSPGRFSSAPGSPPFRDLCFVNVSLDAASPSWACSHAASGSSRLVSPPLCPSLLSSSPSCS